MTEAEGGASMTLVRLDGVVTTLESRVEQLLRLLEGVQGPHTPAPVEEAAPEVAAH
jgi:hypothetical protein